MASINEEIKQKEFTSEQAKASINILFTAKWLENKIGKYLKPHNLTQEQFNVLRILRGQHPKSMCQKDILERMIARQSNVSLIVKKLKNKELIYVDRSTIDKREYVIVISELGLKLLEKIDKELPQEIIFNGLTTSDAFHLNALLDKLRGS